MPKIVDHESRKIRIAEATWEVIVEDGLEHATVRKIAKKARLSVGSLRNTFPTQSDLLQYSMQLVSERVRKRIESKRYDGAPLDAVLALFSEFLPADDERKIEMEVWFVFSAKTLTDPKLKTLFKKVYHDMHGLFREVLLKLKSAGCLKENFDLEIEATRLHTLIDGLGIHYLLYPEKMTHEKMMNALQFHLQSICKS